MAFSYALIREIAWTIGLDLKSGDHINPELEGNLLSGVAEKGLEEVLGGLRDYGNGFSFFLGCRKI